MKVKILQIRVPQGVVVKLAVSKMSLCIKGKRGVFKLKRLKGRYFLYEFGYILVISEVIYSKIITGVLISLLKQIFRNVSNGCSLWLILNGVGYRASVQDKRLLLRIGYRHLLSVLIPKKIKVICPNRYSVILRGRDCHAVFQLASKIYKLQSPEVYKGKGIHFRSGKYRRKKGKRKGS